MSGGVFQKWLPLQVLSKTQLEEAIRLGSVKKDIHHWLLIVLTTHLEFLNISLWLHNLVCNNVGWSHVEWTKYNNFQIWQKSEMENRIKLTELSRKCIWIYNPLLNLYITTFVSTANPKDKYNQNFQKRTRNSQIDAFF